MTNPPASPGLISSRPRAIRRSAVGHPAVAEAAVIGVCHPKWDDRPLLIVQLKQGASATREGILKCMDGKIAKWWMPDDIVFVDGIPHTATGKILKTALRDQFKSYSFPPAAAGGTSLHFPSPLVGEGGADAVRAGWGFLSAETDPSPAC